jgi:AcrR family transcriptional regulator
MRPVTEVETAVTPVREGRHSRGYTGRQGQVLDALEDLFLEEGFTHLTIGEMVARLRCSRRTIYSVAPSREELILIVIDRLLNRMGVEAKARAASHEDPGDAIEAYLQTGVTTLARATQAFNEDIESYLPTRHLYDRHLNIALKVLGGLVETGIAKGVFRSLHPAVVAEILAAAVECIRKPEVLIRANVTHAQALADMSMLLRHGLVQAPDRAGDDGRARPGR